MDDRFVRSWMTGSALLLSALALFSRWSGAPAFGWGLLAGGGWNLLNILLLSRLSRLIFHPREKSIFLLTLFGLLKFPILYGAGFAILRFGAVSPWGAFVGFSIPLLFISLQAIAQCRFFRIEEMLKTRKMYG